MTDGAIRNPNGRYQARMRAGGLECCGTGAWVGVGGKRRRQRFDLNSGKNAENEGGVRQMYAAHRAHVPVVVHCDMKEDGTKGATL